MSFARTKFPHPPDTHVYKASFSYTVPRQLLNQQRVFSPWHYILDFKWRLLIFPEGNSSDLEYMSVYLDCGGPINPPPESKDPSRPKKQPQPSSPPPPPPDDASTASSSSDSVRWRRKADFALNLIKANSLFDRLDRPSDIANFSDQHQRPLPPSNYSTTSLDSLVCNELYGVYKETSHEFTDHIADWGFLEFAPLPHILDPQYLDPYGNFIITVDLTMRDDCFLVENCIRYAEFSSAWNSKKETGRVGLVPYPRHTYLNATLQSLFAIGALRTAVFHLPKPTTSFGDVSETSATYALKKLFAAMECSRKPSVATDLCTAMGWNFLPPHGYFDVQDIKVSIFRRILTELLTEVGPSAIESTQNLASLFQGRIQYTVDCLNLEYRSVIEDNFCDLWLNVRGCQTLYHALNEYTAMQYLSGDNKYRAEGYDQLQEATLHTTITGLPPVLQLFLRRWRYDFSRAKSVVKVNDRFAYDAEIDLNYLVPDSDGSEIFVLQAVIVFEDDIESKGGSYYAYVRQNLLEEDDDKPEDQGWLKFDGNQVIPSPQADATENSFGRGGERDCNAHMLQYVRKSQVKELIYAEPLAHEGSVASDDSSVANETNDQSPGSNADGAENVEASEVSSNDSTPQEGNNTENPNEDTPESNPQNGDSENAIQSGQEEVEVTVVSANQDEGDVPGNAGEATDAVDDVISAAVHDSAPEDVDEGSSPVSSNDETENSTLNGSSNLAVSPTLSASIGSMLEDSAD